MQSQLVDVGYSMVLKTHKQTIFDVRAAAFVVDERSEWEKNLAPQPSVYAVNKEEVFQLESI